MQGSRKSHKFVRLCDFREPQRTKKWGIRRFVRMLMLEASHKIFGVPLASNVQFYFFNCWFFMINIDIKIWIRTLTKKTPRPTVTIIFFSFSSTGFSCSWDFHYFHAEWCMLWIWEVANKVSPCFLWAECEERGCSDLQRNKPAPTNESGKIIDCEASDSILDSTPLTTLQTKT